MVRAVGEPEAFEDRIVDEPHGFLRGVGDRNGVEA